MHRDLTPFNMFVCTGNELKLGDFGIATHQLNPRGVTADAFNLFHVPNEIAWGRVRRWQNQAMSDFDTGYGFLSASDDPETPLPA